MPRPEYYPAENLKPPKIYTITVLLILQQGCYCYGHCLYVYVSTYYVFYIAQSPSCLETGGADPEKTQRSCGEEDTSKVETATVSLYVNTRFFLFVCVLCVTCITRVLTIFCVCVSLFVYAQVRVLRFLKIGG